jgi:hypothetical protein
MVVHVTLLDYLHSTVDQLSQIYLYDLRKPQNSHGGYHKEHVHVGSHLFHICLTFGDMTGTILQQQAISVGSEIGRKFKVLWSIDT